MEERIAHVERNFASLALELGGMARKTARLRDKGDRIAKTLQDFSSTESGTMKKSLDGLAECFSALENCQQLKVCVYYISCHGNELCTITFCMLSRQARSVAA